ncbi:MAG: hypothetical protein ACJ75Z_01540, partial [Solirubrobacterales bacterium]
IVCSFGDLASGLGGLAWDLGGAAAIQLEDDDVRTGSFAIEEGGDAATVAISSGDDVVEAVLAPGIDPVPLEPEEGTGAPLTVTPCAAEVHPRGGGKTVECSGQISRWTTDPLEGAGAFRHLTIAGPEGALVVAIALGPQGLEGHGDERVSAWSIDADGHQSRFGEALISTQYDGDGRPTRVGLELWPGEDSPPRRIACSLLGGADSGGLWAGLFRCQTDGAEGLGSYVLHRV